jgi:hypothetical protein
MSLKISSFSSTLAGGLPTFLLALSLGSSGAMAASKDTPTAVKQHRGQPAYTVRHHAFAGYRDPYAAGYRGRQFANPATLPYGPEYGFLAHVPPNAIRMPGYTFVPGVGILGESCDLPTSACDNRYRDIQ